ncbi:PoNe immunity protein domain-containing protein [Pseudomonas sp. TWP3-2]|uniref:PoNe immunity protein domain-containing protein n=1 Tax=Pseudomonas sp. TWP3-2 TaxID=2804574 RepID=UPI003CF9B96D
MNRRQKFIFESYYNKSIGLYDGTEARWNNETMQADNPTQEKALRTGYFKESAFKALLISYTAGETIESLIPRLEKLIDCYEIYQQALAMDEGDPDISPLAIDDWPEQYEECVQVVSLCILLHRKDLLVRFVSLIDQAGYAHEDTLYEDLLRKHLPGRSDIDEWYHDLYTPLIRAIYASQESEASDLLLQYCKEWYPAFKKLQTNWHDSHLEIEGDDGDYVGYWAFEAAAIAFLYGINDSKVNHMVYPKDLVEYARTYRLSNSPQTSRVDSGRPCTKTGYWFTPAEPDSRRHFNQGEIMPKFNDSGWGDTIWYWSGEE